MAVGPVGLGTVALGRTAGLKLASPARMPSDDEALDLLRTARELGVNLIDTAPAYGISEERLGRLLSRAGPPEAWMICTKVGEEFDASRAGGAEAGGGSHHDFSPAAIAASIDRSLMRLDVETLDLVLLHFSSATDDAGVLEAGEALGALLAARHAGKTRAIGASVATARGGLSAIDRGCDAIMITLNEQDRSMLAVAEAAAARGVGVLVKKALAGGRLGADSLRWVLERPGVACAVLGTTSAAHLREAARIAGRET
ncbi:MAG: aldo/keto reductase [Phycisphaerales bacterium]